MRRQLAQGHNPRMEPSPLWDMPAIEGASAVCSTAKDMTAFLKACMGFQKTSLAPSFKTILQTRRPTGVPGTDTDLGWFISSDSNNEIVWKSGQTGGCLTNIAFSPKTRRGSIVLANGQLNSIGVGLKLVDPNFVPGNLGALFN